MGGETDRGRAPTGANLVRRGCTAESRDRAGLERTATKATDAARSLLERDRKEGAGERELGGAARRASGRLGFGREGSGG